MAENGITCPECRFQYALTRGGCMHFTCTQCKHEFCSGCGRPFLMGARCNVGPYCAKLGLHSHHPRNCLFYLRDKDPIDLQRLLKVCTIFSVYFFLVVLVSVFTGRCREAPQLVSTSRSILFCHFLFLSMIYCQQEYGVDFLTEPVSEDEDITNCAVQLQRETPLGLIDDVCGSEVVEGHAGLCRFNHYIINDR